MTVTHKDVMAGIRAKLNTGSVTAVVPNARVKRGQPQGTTLPMIRMHSQAMSDDISTLGRRVFQMFHVSVIAVSTSEDQADEISALIDAALERTTLTIANGTHGSTKRVGAPSYPEIAPDGTTVYHSGGIYQIGVRPT